MAATAEQLAVLSSQECENVRTLTEVRHLMRARTESGSYPLDVQQAVQENLVTFVQEATMGGSVSTTYQPAAELRQENEERRRTFLWKGLGKTALAVAESGYAYHRSEAAFKRVAVEVQEARRSEDHLTPGVLQCFISPRMSVADAPYETAQAEHLGDDDAIRTYRAVTEDGIVIGRQTQSLLVRDIPLDAWVRMCKDSNNVFHKSLEVGDETSALSVMKLFEQLDLPESALPEGPVSLVAAVAPYITEKSARASVEQQVADLRQDQTLLRQEAERTARQWLQFELSLAESLHAGQMQEGVRKFVMVMQAQWTPGTVQLLHEHALADAQYRMTDELAVHLEQAWQKVYLSEVAIAVGDKRSLRNVDTEIAQRLQAEAQRIRALERAGQFEVEAVLHRLLQAVSISGATPGAGCAGQNLFSFGKQSEGGMGRPNDEEEAEEGIGAVHYAVCRTEGCPSRPRVTEVGGCDVCLDWCQRQWNKGVDPATVYKSRQETAKPAPVSVGQEMLMRLRQKKAVRNGGFAVAAAQAA